MEQVGAFLGHRPTEVTFVLRQVFEKANATTFNSDHSRRRIDSENAIAELKEWASIRGRGDISLFYDQTTFEDAVACVLGLNNFRSMIALNSHDV